MQVTNKIVPFLARTFPRRNDTLLAFVFILPSMIGLGVFTFIPAIRGILLSFTNSDLLTRADYVGLDNYSKLITDQQFWSSLKITITYVLLNIPFQTLLGLGLALLMSRLTKSNIVRGIILLPHLFPIVMITLVWLTILDYDFGPLNGFLALVGLPKFGFLNQDTMIPSIAWINIWRHVGYTALLFFAGLQTIPTEIYEAAKIDGANEWNIFTRITLPLLRPVTAFILITSLVGSFQVWDSIQVASTPSGGPGGASRVIFWYITNLAFTRFDMGYAATIAVALFIISVVIAVAQMQLLKADESDLA